MWFFPYLYRYPISIPYAACFVKPFFVAVRCFSHFWRENTAERCSYGNFFHSAASYTVFLPVQSGFRASIDLIRIPFSEKFRSYSVMMFVSARLERCRSSVTNVTSKGLSAIVSRE